MSSTSRGVSESKASEWLKSKDGTREENAARRDAVQTAESRVSPDYSATNHRIGRNRLRNLVQAVAARRL